MNGLDDIMRSARLWAKLYARQALDTCGVGAISRMAIAKEYLVTGSAIVLRQKSRQIAMLLGDTRDLLSPPYFFKSVKSISVTGANAYTTST